MRPIAAASISSTSARPTSGARRGSPARATPRAASSRCAPTSRTRSATHGSPTAGASSCSTAEAATGARSPRGRSRRWASRTSCRWRRGSRAGCGAATRWSAEGERLARDELRGLHRDQVARVDRAHSPVAHPARQLLEVLEREGAAARPEHERGHLQAARRRHRVHARTLLEDGGLDPAGALELDAAARALREPLGQVEIEHARLPGREALALAPALEGGGAVREDVAAAARAFGHAAGAHAPLRIALVGLPREDDGIDEDQTLEALRALRRGEEHRRAAERVAEAERHRPVLARQVLRERDEVAAELRPAVGQGALRLRGVSVSARVEGDHAEALAQLEGDGLPHGGAEAVRVVEQREGPVPAPVEERELDAPPRERDEPAADAFEHGSRVSRRGPTASSAASGIFPACPTPISASTLRCASGCARTSRPSSARPSRIRASGAPPWPWPSSKIRTAAPASC